jgi:xylulose-5-phosphate/fructose-6-phosphate phosphoketolase
MNTETATLSGVSVSDTPLTADELRRIDAYWRAANYLSVGQIYLYANPMLREPLKIEHIKPRLLGHWGTTPGLNFVYVHFNRLIKKYDLNVIYIAGPGHGGPGMVANTYLEGTYTELYPNITQDEEGMERILPVDENLSPDGRVIEVLSEHMCQGFLEGYLLTGRHGLFSCYEAFIHIVDSMFNQHAKWLKVTRNIEWRRPISSLNYLLTSHVWRQDHNGFTHQDPGFIDHVVNKKADVVRVYLPPDANCVLSVTDHCLRSRHYVNVIVAGKQPALQWLDMERAIEHCTNGIGIWDWASTDTQTEPDVVMACAGDVPTLETLAAVDLLRQHFPDIKIRVINVVDLMTIQPSTEHPHGLSDADFDSMFTVDKPVIFAYHGYPWLIHRLTYRRRNHNNLHVRGYKEEGTTTTPFDMTVLNDLDRFHLAGDVVDRVPRLQRVGAHFKQRLRNLLVEHKQYIREHGEDMPEIRDWKWPY